MKSKPSGSGGTSRGSDGCVLTRCGRAIPDRYLFKVLLITICVIGSVFAQDKGGNLISLRVKDGTIVVDDHGIVKFRSTAWLIETFRPSCACAWALSHEKKWGIIDINGKWILRPRFLASPEEGDNLALVKEPTPDAKFRFLALNGKYLPGEYEQARPFSEGMAAVRINGKWGYINSSGENVIPAFYDDALPFSDGIGMVILGGRQLYIKTDGSVALTTEKDNVGYFADGRAIFRQNGLNGIINRSGAEVLPATYPEIREFSNGHAAFRTVRGLWGFLDVGGRIKIPASFLRVRDFSEGLAAVKTPRGKWGFIDENGRFAVPANYDDEPSDFRGGLADVGSGDREEDDAHVFIDKLGHVRFTKADVLRNLLRRRTH